MIAMTKETLITGLNVRIASGRLCICTKTPENILINGVKVSVVYLSDKSIIPVYGNSYFTIYPMITPTTVINITAGNFGNFLFAINRKTKQTKKSQNA